MEKKIISKILNQTIGSTNEDSQGEKIPKIILEELCQPGRSPIHQNHQPERRPIGYIENRRLIPDKKHPGEWILKGDVYYTSEPQDIRLDQGGFSWSMTKINKKYSVKDSKYALYLPYPFYKNEKLLNSLAKLDKNLSLGYWYKKSADPKQISLLVSFTLFAFGPAYAKFFNNILWPKIKEILRNIIKIRETGIARVDFVQVAQINGHQTNVYFIPDLNNEEKCFEKVKIKNAFDLIYKHALKDSKGINPGYLTIKLHWDQNIQEYFIDNIEYQDGEVSVKGMNL